MNSTEGARAARVDLPGSFLASMYSKEVRPWAVQGIKKKERRVTRSSQLFVAQIEVDEENGQMTAQRT